MTDSTQCVELQDLVLNQKAVRSTDARVGEVYTRNTQNPASQATSAKASNQILQTLDLTVRVRPHRPCRSKRRLHAAIVSAGSRQPRPAHPAPSTRKPQACRSRHGGAADSPDLNIGRFLSAATKEKPTEHAQCAEKSPKKAHRRKIRRADRTGRLEVVRGLPSAATRRAHMSRRTPRRKTHRAHGFEVIRRHPSAATR